MRGGIQKAMWKVILSQDLEGKSRLTVPPLLPLINHQSYSLYLLSSFTVQPITTVAWAVINFYLTHIVTSLDPVFKSHLLSKAFPHHLFTVPSACTLSGSYHPHIPAWHVLSNMLYSIYCLSSSPPPRF